MSMQYISHNYITMFLFPEVEHRISSKEENEHTRQILCTRCTYAKDS